MNNKITVNKVIGCIQGVAIGDAYGAPYEGGIIERTLWKFIQLSSDDILYTDDTQTTLDVIDSMTTLKCISSDDIALKMSLSYTWLKGYGKNTAKILKKVRAGYHWSDLNESVFKGGSFGNGAAIRACPIGLFFSPQLEANKVILKKVSKDVASITHCHELGIHGAYLYALTVAFVVNEASNDEIIATLKKESEGTPFYYKIEIADQWLSSGVKIDIAVIRRQLGNGMSALDSVITAIFLALSYFERPIESLLRECVNLKGDTDSIASMACGLWGAKNGDKNITTQLFERIESNTSIISAAKNLYALIRASE